MPFVKATKSQAKGRIALIGVSGSGKTMTAQIWARVLAGPEGTIATIDTECGSASKYADEFIFDTMNLESFTPRSYINAIGEAEAAGYDVLIIDSLSHAWMGKDGVLAEVDKITARSRSGNAFTSGWREMTPEHNAMIDALVRCKCHLIVTMRSKTDWVVEEVNGKKIPRKIGLAPVQRDGLEYEFDLVGDMDTEHKLIVTKSRCKALDGAVILKPDAKPAEVLHAWLTNGTPVVTPEAPKLASAEQVGEIKKLLSVVRLPEGTIDKWWRKANVQHWEDMPADAMGKCIDYVRSLVPGPKTDTAAGEKAGSKSGKKEPQPIVPVEIAEQVKSWAKFEELFNEAAMDNGWPPQTAAKALQAALSCIDHLGKGEMTKVEWRVGTLIALRENRLDPATGKKVNPAAAASAA